MRCQIVSESANPPTPPDSSSSVESLTSITVNLSHTITTMSAPILRHLMNPAVRNYGPILATWGAAGGVVALFLLEPTPIARSDIFSQIPVVGAFWQRKLDARLQKD
ncbi:hypothetical protein DFS34DRAFT_649157 [Phlyctochytrium arcticum]|nr:hypothetical protein DFS34DRAFT_649157 [Phlyctochytrium arcticum]